MVRIASFLQRFPALSFIILSLGMVYIILIPLYYSHLAGSLYPVLKIFFAFTPTLSAIILTLAIQKEELESFFSKLFVKDTAWYWYLAALMIFPLLGFCGMGGRYFYDGYWAGWESFSSPLEIIGMSIPLLLFPGIAEEFGWRGFLQPQLQKKWHWFMASAIVGLIWATWHYRDFLMGDWSREQNGVLWFYVITINASIIIGWFTWRAKGNIIIAMLGHFGANVVFSFFPIFKTMSYTSAYFYIGAIGIMAVLLLVFEGLFKRTQT